ncbi:MAG: hypothetical protein COB67_00460 [SAR324 cluster bacterium]|uniref:Uncharacterized protein n=1 Tax=SAR324 cluster bacterium TaxID=2024889 RepID=A0A2A4TBH0_9DELT|nr:MAG: hypothetical protein COB67_00460 [SAR324 cluster bacterium]
MSGSPVFIQKNRAVTVQGKDKWSRHHMHFLGIYSGRIGDENDAQLGRVWKAASIVEMLDSIDAQELI